MSTTSIVVPPEDTCVVTRLSQILARRLVYGNDAPAQRRTVLRAIFGLQRLPILIPSLNISISAGRCQLEINPEQCGFVSYTEDWHTEFRIQYFSDSSHCIEGFEILEGDAKIAAAFLRLDNFDAAMDAADELTVEDYSTDGAVDEPPMPDYLEYAQSYNKS